MYILAILFSISVFVLALGVLVSQEISSPGKIVAEAKFPRIFGRPNLTERPYFLGNIAAPRKFCRLGLKVLI